ncbi:conserved hypothetical protein [Vibrio coralliirubri]|nr:conserved hypothetical protein [Vibrio coralliirubri]
MMGIEHDGSTFIVDKEVHQAVSDSLNDIQRLLGKRLAISFDGFDSNSRR